jgi:D-glycero-D-manno-heptose 1,7-bisphosphate phosphatase
LRIDQAVILIGGQGTRLGALTQSLAKPMLEVGGRPLIEHVIAQLARFGVRKILLLAGHHGALPRERYHGHRLFGAELSVLVEPEPLGTGGALSFAFDKLDAQFILTNGDTFFDADLLPLIQVAADPQWSAAMLLRRIEDATRYGGVELDSRGIIRVFTEKSADAGKKAALVNAGTYVMRRDRVLAAIGKAPCSLEDYLFPRLAANGTLAGIVADGYFVDIGIPQSLETARCELLTRRTRPAAFLDRDGVLNIDHGYTHRQANLVMIAGAPAAVRLLNEAAFYVIVVTNQAGVARGCYTEAAVDLFNMHMQDTLMMAGAHVDAFYYCPHHPQGAIKELAIRCGCRKPEPGMFEQAARDWPIDRNRSFMIGDKDGDLAAAAAFNVRGIKFDAQSCSLVELVRKELGRQGSATCGASTAPPTAYSG